jgi:F0F1-type ATP synthase membrane subunit c/vacuolar-type H+-ATPase subunit K
MMKQPPADNTGPEARLRVMRILWAVFLVNVGLFVVVTRLINDGSGAEGADGTEGVPPLLYALAALALSSVVASFVLKASFYRRAAERRESPLVQTGFIIALALCESAALFGVVGVFVTRCDYAYALLGLGALGMALHFPRREQVEAAYLKQVG